MTTTSPPDDEESEDHERQCPVCLTLVETLTSGPCQHPTCIPCMEQILNATGEKMRWPPPSATDHHLSAPTLGRCPICRREFDACCADCSSTHAPGDDCPPVLGACKHTFHLHCILKWVSEQGARKPHCPMCRAECMFIIFIVTFQN